MPSRTAWIAFAIAAAVVLSIRPAKSESCIASVYWIGDSSQSGTRTASGIPLNNGALTAAHKTIPFRTRVRVTNKQNGRSVIVMISDRGPFVRGRCLDVTKAGARALGFSGLARVSIQRL